MKSVIFVYFAVILVGNCCTGYFSSIAVDSSGCTTVKLTTKITPVTSTFSFAWFVNNNGATGDVLLAAVGLDGNGNILVQLRDNAYSGRYEISNEPLVLEPINAPFNSTLTFMDLTPDETFDFGVRQGSVRVASPSVSRPTCILNVNYCDNCVSEIVCGSLYEKPCDCGTRITVNCPNDPSNFVDVVCDLVDCDASSLEEENLIPSNGQNALFFNDRVSFICKDGYVGNEAVYICSSGGFNDINLG